MTKHESHIALLLLALIAAGVLGYQVVNSGFDNSTDAWPNALLNPNPDNHHFSIEIESQPPLHPGIKAQEKPPGVKRSREVQYRYSESPEYKYVNEGDQNVSAASNSQAGGSMSTEHSQANGSYLNSDVHRESISLILGSSSPIQMRGGVFSFEILLNDLTEEMTTGQPNDPDRYRIEDGSSRQVVITQVSNENTVDITGINNNNNVEISQQFNDRNVVRIAQNYSGNSALIMQQGYRNRVAGSGQFTLNKINEIFTVQNSHSIMEIEQSGDFNQADIVQERSDLTLVQVGADHEFISHQYESNSTVTQTGFSNSITVDQSESETTILQEGSNNKVSLRQM